MSQNNNNNNNNNDNNNNVKIDSSEYKILIINSSEYELEEKIADTTCKTLNEVHHVKNENIFRYTIIDITEIPLTVSYLINKAKENNIKFDAVICIGIIKNNFSPASAISANYFINDSIIHDISKISLKTFTPIINGILTYQIDISNSNYRDHATKLVNKAIEMAKVIHIKSK